MLPDCNGMFHTPGTPGIPPFGTTLSSYLFPNKYLITLGAMTEKNILPSVFRRETGLIWVIAVEFCASGM